MIALSPFIPQMFVNVSAAQKELATYLIIVYASFLWAFSLSTGVYMTLRAGGKSLLTFLLDSGTMWGIVVPLAWILALYTPLPLVGIYIAVQSVDLLKSAIGLMLVRRGTWIRNLTLEFQVEA
jgi:Na+-driven multidrug efflux pump